MKAHRGSLLLIATVLLVGCASYQPLPTVERVDLDRYLGTWYEIAKIPNRFQEQCVSDTRAEYAREGESIRVVNRCRTSTDTEEIATGVAHAVEGSGNARLRVSFFRPFYGNYWVLSLDPDYRWVLVGEPSRQYGWILSRTPSLAPEILRSLLDHAETVGYSRSAFQLSPQSPLPDTPQRLRCDGAGAARRNC